MDGNWEPQFGEWARPPGKTEDERCGNAASAIRNAIRASEKLQSRGVTVYVQGSYQNNTNVRKDSDVDVGIVCTDTFFYETLPNGTSRETLGITPATYSYALYKDEVEEALVNHFGREAVKRGNKAFDVHETSYHVEADVAPFFEHRRYLSNGQYLSGEELTPDNGQPLRVINWPQQHYDNGVRKNVATSRRYKSVVRILKSLRNMMADDGIDACTPACGFLIECLVWNVPDNYFGHATYSDDVRDALAFLYNNTRSELECKEWGEVSELKYLFSLLQKWSRAQGHLFVSSAWDYIGFDN